MNVIERLKPMIKKLHWNPTRIAAYLNAPASTVYKWFYGSVQPGSDYVKALRHLREFLIELDQTPMRYCSYLCYTQYEKRRIKMPNKK